MGNGIRRNRETKNFSKHLMIYAINVVYLCTGQLKSRPLKPGRMRGFSQGLTTFCLLIGELGH